MHKYALFTVIISLPLFRIVSAQPPPSFTSTCPIGYLCGFGTAGSDGTTAFTFGPATTTAPAQPIPTIPGIVQVDDTDPRIDYSPPMLWQAATIGGCPTCFGNPNDTQTFNKTWHEGRRTLPSDGPLTATFTFTGTGVSVYAILPTSQRTDGLHELTTVSFLIDGAVTSTSNWTWNPPPFNPPAWNISVPWFQQEIFNSPPLKPGNHNIQMIGASQGDSWFLLDYIAYRTSDAPQSQSLSNVVTPSPDSNANGVNIPSMSRTITSSPVVSTDPPTPTNSSNDTPGKLANAVSLSLLWFIVGSGSMLLSWL